MLSLRPIQRKNPAVDHWDRVYVENAPDKVSWYQPSPDTSLELIAETQTPLGAPVVDVGGGASSLACHLIKAGYTDLTVVDIAAGALAQARDACAAAGDRVAWVQADIRSHEFDRVFALWHDRAVFHFMVDTADRDAYITVLKRALRTDGDLILATFATDGPTRCSGLPVARYAPDQLASILGTGFELISARHEDHRTPSGAVQAFTYARFRHLGETPAAEY